MILREKAPPGWDRRVEKIKRKTKKTYGSKEGERIAFAIAWKQYKLKEDETPSFRQFLDKPTPSVGSIAKRHGVSPEYISAQLDIGIKVEKEHTSHEDVAREIALDHLAERPNYYQRLKKVEGE